MNKNISSTQKVLNVWAIILIVWAIYRIKFTLPEWFDEFIAKPLVFVGPVIWYIKRIEKKAILSGLWLNFSKISSDTMYGILIGLIFFAVGATSYYFKTGSVNLLTPIFSAGIPKFVTFLIFALATGISEEILSRGFILKRLYEDSKNVLSSSFNTSVLFLILHIPILFTNAKLTGSLLLMFMATDMLLSLANSFIFLDRKSLTLPILIHTFYNLAIILYV